MPEMCASTRIALNSQISNVFSPEIRSRNYKFCLIFDVVSVLRPTRRHTPWNTARNVVVSYSTKLFGTGMDFDTPLQNRSANFLQRYGFVCFDVVFSLFVIISDLIMFRQEAGTKVSTGLDLNFIFNAIICDYLVVLGANCNTHCSFRKQAPFQLIYQWNTPMTIHTSRKSCMP